MTEPVGGGRSDMILLSCGALRLSPDDLSELPAERALAGARSPRLEVNDGNGGDVKYDQEVLEWVGQAGGMGDFGVVIFQPHLDHDLTTIGLDTPDGRRHELDAEDALALARLLEEAVPVLGKARAAAAADA